ncbi:MAG: DUF2573 family protein [Bacillaceae bacterium]
MNEQFEQKFDGLLEKYTELLLGKNDEQLVEKVKMWMMYTYMSKSMPALVQHWNSVTPDGKAEMMALISEIKKLNDEHRAKKA